MIWLSLNKHLFKKIFFNIILTILLTTAALAGETRPGREIVVGAATGGPAGKSMPETAALTLIKDGKTFATIVIPDQATLYEAKAAKALQKFLQRMSNAELPIKRDDENVSGTIVSVGLTRLVPAEIKKKLKIGEKLVVTDAARDSFVVLTRGRTLFLVGHRDLATLYSVYHFLEGLGCRWFFGCEAGEVIPRSPTIEVGVKNDYQIPDFAVRIQFQWGAPQKGPVIGGRRQEWLVSTDGNAGPIKDQKEWCERNLLTPGMVPGESGHNYQRIWPPSLFRTHPEYFGEIDGIRRKDAQPCLSNPEVIKIGIKWAERELLMHPANEMVTFAPRDGNPYCQCAKCREIGNAADQNMYLANQVARALQGKYPSKMVAVWAYAQSAVSPHIKADGYDQGRDRVIVELKNIYAKLPLAKLIQAWSGVSHNLFVYTYTDWFYYTWPWGAEGNPVYYLDQMANFYPEWKKQGVHLVANQTELRWGRVGFSRYVQAKKLWNVNTDTRSLQWDFAQKMFPSAPEAFYNYTSLGVELFSEAHFAKPERNHREFLRQAYRILEDIRQKAKTPEEKRRWQWYALYLHEQSLEYNLRLAKTDAEKYAAIKALVSYLKGINSFNITDALSVIQGIYANRLGKHKGGRGLGVIDIYNEKIPGPERSLRRILPDIPPQPIDSDKIDELFIADRDRVALFQPAESVEILPKVKAKYLAAEGWNTPTGISRRPTDFTRRGVKIDFDLPWIKAANSHPGG
jgi:hypothetical protein